MQCRTSESVSRPYGGSAVSPITAVVEAIADLEGIDPTEIQDELGFTVYEYIDPDSLDTLVNEGENVAISFDVHDYHVWIDGSDLFVERS